MEDLISVNYPISEEHSIIKVIGVGGGGSNAVNYMCRKGIKGVEFVICNTDIQALHEGNVKNRIQIGKELTSGLGAGCDPERGRDALKESQEYVQNILSDNTKMVFIAAGMGGGTGTGAAPEVARMAKEMGILTIGIVTLPFSFEGARKMHQAMEGVDELEKNVDALILIINDRLVDIHGDLKLSEAFQRADDVLTIAAKSIAEIITNEGYIAVDFADVDSVMRNGGQALMGASEATGENRAEEALKNALVSPLLKNFDIKGASNVLLYVHYNQSHEVTQDEISYLNEQLREYVGDDVNIIWGAGQDSNLSEDALRVTVIAVGFNKRSKFQDVRAAQAQAKPAPKSQPQAAPQPERKPARPSQPSPFKVEELEDLEMIIDDSSEIERRAREERASRQRPQATNRRPANKNKVPEVDGWFKRKLGDFFSDESERDTELR